MTSYRKATSLSLSLIIITCTILLDFARASSHLGCAPGHECYYPYKPTDDVNMYHNRKILLMELMGSSKTGVVAKEKINYGEELRTVPSGPDPLHHNGGPQKRPRISP